MELHQLFNILSDECEAIKPILSCQNAQTIARSKTERAASVSFVRATSIFPANSLDKQVIGFCEIYNLSGSIFFFLVVFFY